MDELDLESLFAAVGLGPILAARPTLHKYQLQQAAGLPAEIRRRVLRFVASDAFKPGKDVPDFDYDETLGLISQGAKFQGLSPAQAQALNAVAPDMAIDMGAFANKILAWANPLLPRETRPAVIGARPEDPAPSSLADFRRLWQVALDPMIVLDDMEDGSLSEDQVIALSLLYPGIYAEMKQAVVDEMAVMEARRKGWEPAPQKAALLQMLRGEQTFDPELAAATQQAYAQEQAQAPRAGPPRRRGGGGGKAGVGDALTPGQRATTGASGAET